MHTHRYLYYFVTCKRNVHQMDAAVVYILIYYYGRPTGTTTSNIAMITLLRAMLILLNEESKLHIHNG